MITPFDDFVYLVNNVLLGEEPVSRIQDRFQVPTILLECFIRLLILDHRRLHLAHWNCCCVRCFCIVVLFSRCSEGVANTAAL